MKSGSVNGLVIRPARPGEAPLVLSFIKELAEFEKLSHEVQATAAMLEARLFGPRPFAEVIFAELDGAPVGFALFFHNFSTFLAKPGLYLEDLFVRPSARGKGIGKALLTHLAQVAVERDCGRMEWWVLDWNADAMRFYEGLGAKAMDEWTVYRLTGDTLTAAARG